MTKTEKYFPDKLTAFQQIKVYIGLKDELIRVLYYFMYRCYGKHWKKGERYDCIDFLIHSIKQARHTNINLARDIKENKELFQEALDELVRLINDADPVNTDDYSLRMIISFHKDMEKVINTVMRSKKDFNN